MNARRDPDRLVKAFLMEGQTELADQVFDVVRATIEHKPQRVVIGPWRMPLMNKFVSVGLGAAAVVVALIVGIQLFGPASGGVGRAPSAEPTAPPSPTRVGGTVEYQLDGAPVTTVVNAVADGASVSGTAVATFVGGPHTVRLECAARDGDTWALGGTIEQTTVTGEKAGGWSAVIVRDGSPQDIGIWVSDDKSEGVDCEGWLAANAFSAISPDFLVPAESGALVPPPDLAP